MLRGSSAPKDVFTTPGCSALAVTAVAGQLVREQDVGQLGLVVSARTQVGPFALEVVEVDPSQGLRVGSNRDHAGRGALLQPVEEQVGE